MFGYIFALGVLTITTSLASTRVSAGIITIFFVSIRTSFISVIVIVLDVLYVDVVNSVPRSASGALLCKQVVIQMFVLVLKIVRLSVLKSDSISTNYYMFRYVPRLANC